MILLGMSDIPENGTDLEKALNAGWHQLSDQLTHNPFQLEGYATDSIETMQVLLSGVAIDSLAKIKQPVFLETHAASMLVENFSVLADAATYGGATVSGHLIGNGIRLDYCRDTDDRIWLVPSKENQPTGEARVTLGTAAINQLAQGFAEKATRDQGVKVTGITVESEASAAGDRLDLKVQIKARKMIAGVTLHIDARLDVRNKNTLVLSDINVRGEGTLGAMASRLVGDAVQKWKGFEVPLHQFALGASSIQSVQVSTVDGVEIKATFG